MENQGNPLVHIHGLNNMTKATHKQPRFRRTQFTSHERVEYAGIKCPEDKPYIESFNRSYKTEEIYRREYLNFQEARSGWESYRTWYQSDRLHQSLDYMIPVQYAQKAQNSILLVA